MAFKCLENCGSCCGGIKFDIRKWNKLKNKTVTKDYMAQRVSRTEIYVVSNEDQLCVFLDRVTKKCLIYEERPTLCRMYGSNEILPCPFLLPDGSPRPTEKLKEWEETFDKQLKRVCGQIVRRGNCETGSTLKKVPDE